METPSVHRTIVSETLEKMKKLSEEISGESESPTEEAHGGHSLRLQTGLKVTVPTEAVEGELRKKTRMKYLILLAAVIIMPAVAMFKEMMGLAITQGIGVTDDSRSLGPGYKNTYKIVYGVSGIISGVLITVFNYRPVAAAGAVVSCLGSLVTSLLHTKDKQAITFFYCILPGLGNNFLYTTVVVAVLECFGDKRMLIVIFTFVAQFIIEFIVMLISLLDTDAVLSSSWRVTLGIMCGIYGLCLLASCALVPLNLYMKNNPRQSLRSRIMNIENLSVFRTPLLYAMSGVFFFTGIGLDIPLDEVGRWYGFAPLIVLAAVLLAMIISCCCFRKLPRETSLAAITILGLFMGVWTLSVKGFDAQTYTCIYSLLYGMGYGLREPIARNLIPLVMGDKYLGLTVGCLSFASGVGSIIGEKSSNAMIEDLRRIDAPFYLSGISLITSSLMMLVVIKVVRNANRTACDTNHEERGAVDVTQPPTTETISLPRVSVHSV